MDPDQFQLQQMQFGSGLAATVLNPAVLILVFIAGLMICFAGRRKVLAPFLVLAIMIPTDQVFVLGSFHFPMLRILALFALGRLFWAKLSANEAIFSGGMNGIDKSVVVLNVFTTVDGVLLWRQAGMLFNQVGTMCTLFGVYFLLRFLIQDEEDVRRTLRVLGWVTIVVAVIMIGEQATGKNVLYATLGGARASMSIMERDDHLRANGPFAHPNLAGTFGGIVLPLFFGLWWKEARDRKFAAVAIAAAIVISFAASSSTALGGLIGGIVGLCFWPLHRQMRLLRWSIVVALVSLHLYMKSPVWHLISDIDLTGGSSSYHRFMLVDQCIRHFWDWILVGTKSFGTWGWDMWDLSDQYVATADTAGLIPLISLLAMLVFGFKYLGRALRASEGDRKQEWFIWALGASLFANLVAFFGISYFDQTIVAWYALLAMISGVTLSARNSGKVQQTEPEIAKSDISFQSRLAQSSIQS